MVLLCFQPRINDAPLPGYTFAMRFLLLAIATTYCAWSAESPFLHPLFSDHAVLQRDRDFPVWGWSTPGDRIQVQIAEQLLTTVADASGRWQVTVAALPAGGPHVLSVQGAKTTTAGDLLLGDVWLCSGQSNMEWPVRNMKNSEQEVASASLPRLRQFLGTKRFSLKPEAVTGGGWTVCDPQTAGSFTAVGFAFGRELSRTLDVPIGLINASWGGTRIESWTSRQTLTGLPRCASELQELTEFLSGTTNPYTQRLQSWWQQIDPAPQAERKAADTTWKQAKVPGKWEANGLDGFDGVVRYALDFTVPAALAGKAGRLLLGPIDDRDTTWLNGREIGQTDSWNQPRVYTVPVDTLRAGSNSIAVRVVDTGGSGGFQGKPEDLRLEIGDQRIPLAGTWQYFNGKPLRELPPMPTAFDRPNVITSLSNGMIEPLVPTALRGVIWYQGESNARSGSGYEQLLPALIADWRTRFHAPELPFGIVQLANFMPAVAEPVQESGWPWLREQQLLASQRIPHTGLAVTIDIGEANDIHPRNKQDVGLRLANWALHDVYGKTDRARSGPVYDSLTSEGPALRLRFRETTGGLAARGELAGFAIASADGPWVAAQARIHQDTVIVSSLQVPAPTRVRYGWANNPTCTLTNGAGLPASPFRTDR